MKKKAVSLLLALCLGLLPATASAAEAELPDWYFLFAIFKNVDADGTDVDGKDVHVTYTMDQVEVDAAKDHAREFEKYMNSLGVIRAHTEVVVIDTPVTELNEYKGGSYLGQKQATPLLEGEEVDLDRYDHVTCIVSLDNLRTSYGGITGSAFENGTGQSCINFVNKERCLKYKVIEVNPWVPGYPVHEFLHFMERMNKKWGQEFSLHDIMNNFYERVDGEFEECYTDILLNRAKGTSGTGVAPVAWQYPPHVLRTVTELTIPSGVTSIGHDAFLNYTNITSVTIPSSVTYIDVSAFHGCTGLTSVTIPDSVTSIEGWTFAKCTALTKVSIPASVTSIGGAAFQGCSNLTSVTIPASVTRVEDYAFANCSRLTDVYYSGSEEQWKAVQISNVSNSALSRATIHYNSIIEEPETSKPVQSVKFTDVPAGAYYCDPVQWAVAQGVTAGTSDTTFSPDQTCTQGQILTFLWRAKGSPAPSGAAGGSGYYAAAMQWAKEQGIVSGGLAPDAPCTRADVVMYLWKLAGSPAPSGQSSFTDVPADADDANAVAWAVEKGVTAGTSTSTFSPDSVCTRGQIVTFLYRALAG